MGTLTFNSMQPISCAKKWQMLSHRVNRPLTSMKFYLFFILFIFTSSLHFIFQWIHLKASRDGANLTFSGISDVGVWVFLRTHFDKDFRLPQL